MRAVSDATAKLIAWIEDEIRWPGPSKTEVIVAALEKERQPEALVAPPPTADARGRGHGHGDARWAGIIGVERQVVWHDLGVPMWQTPSLTQGTKLGTTMERYDFEFDIRLDIIAVQHVSDPAVSVLHANLHSRCPEGLR